MIASEDLFPQCATHGKPTQRHVCRECNAAYMRGYLRRRRLDQPARAIWDRAYKRAKVRGVVFSLPRDSVEVPRTCPVLGLPIQLRDRRSAYSPSLDRIVPARGYVPGNVRVISDYANRLKGARNLSDLHELAHTGPVQHREEYSKIVAYVERELMLGRVQTKAAQGGEVGAEWGRIATILDRLFRESLTKREHGK